MSEYDDWIRELATTLGLNGDVDDQDILAFTAEIAHGVARPAAPVSAFLVGLAAGRAGAGADDVAAALTTARAALAQRTGPVGD